MDLSQRAHPHRAPHPQQKPQLPSNPLSAQPPVRTSSYGTGSLPSGPSFPLTIAHGTSPHKPGSASTSPVSISHGLASTAASATSKNPPNDYADGEEDDGSPTIDGEEPAKKKQKRNKPTLSCHECVERKTKVCLFFFLNLRPLYPFSLPFTLSHLIMLVLV